MLENPTFAHHKQLIQLDPITHNCNLIKIIFSSCSRFLIIMSLRENLTKYRRHPRVSDLGSMTKLTNQIVAFRILRVITAIWLVNSLTDKRMSTAFHQILTQRHIRKREQEENMILIRLPQFLTFRVHSLYLDKATRNRKLTKANDKRITWNTLNKEVSSEEQILFQP